MGTIRIGQGAATGQGMSRDGSAQPETHEHTCERMAMLKVDGRYVQVRPCSSSEVGHVDGVCVAATSPDEVREAVNCLPGRVLVVDPAAIDQSVIALIVAAAQRGTFQAIVVNGASPFEDHLPIPVVIIEEDAWSPTLKMPARYVVSVYDDIDLVTRERRRSSMV